MSERSGIQLSFYKLLLLKMKVFESIFSTVRYMRKSPQLVNFLGCTKILRSYWTLHYHLLHFTYFFNPTLT